MWPAMLAPTNFILRSTGWLEGGMTVLLEKYVIDAEMLAMFYHLMGGFQINEETLALDSIDEVGLGGHHFGTAHTIERFSTAFYQPPLPHHL
jgi:trimethylamine--corrinoid protein Co-methyltransferase